MVVAALIATAAALVTLALPDPDRAVLEKDGLRLAAMLEAARAESRSSGRPITWQPLPGGFRFEGIATLDAPLGQGSTGLRAPFSPWLDGRVSVVDGQAPLLLGPEPIIAAQRVTLVRGNQQLLLASDGLHPFAATLLQ
ncbi:MAG: hypothetical protein GAK30_03458 [Paracidovorax wautersii]|uniref:General secretion pathway protein H n=1 Tax=Paracidovorax wautersii TaxID=1177982 RepID=A0A7V8FL81_9BURK|nr:MAG: hypothetical protein GAK30_03458 [Paracidovorax wautersii]